CLECHEDVATNFMKTPHWTWSRKQVVNGKEIELGKINAFNNFCTTTASNRVQCSECHAGYGWAEEDFDFTDKSKVDCLVCHDSTGTYHKDGDNSGWPKHHVNLTAVAKSVSKPVRQNCTTCHALGGGGNNAKHGDIGLVLDYPDRSIDVHMDADGNDFSCQECHVTENHAITGANMATSPDGYNTISCVQCHDAAPHAESRLNDHTARVACQTCHIPIYAKEDKTQTDWDWSTGGRDVAPEGVDGKEVTYKKSVGTQTWKANLVPSYDWFNGKSSVYLTGDKIDPSVPTSMTAPLGDINDKNAKIHPFKIHTGKQVYDVKNKYFITNHIYGSDGFWDTADWERSIKIGMEVSDLPYSGEYGFAETTMHWRLDHMVAPAEDALGCLDCHGDDGRMDWKALGYKADPMK
ncbi:MAG: tetrathionate reductase family octaheme c-type cytochrome, partial [Desulfuromonadales bacterium]|nr:tetrathionate reductase family octaheme c-type cytochrome [Desulfuromonadales bacterium]